MDYVNKSQVAEDIRTIVLNYLEGEGDSKSLANEEEKYIDAVNYNGLLALGIARIKDGKGFALVSRARHIHSRLEMIDVILDKISSRVQDKIQIARQRINSVASVCGLASLPCEVLSLVLSFVVHGSPSSSKPRSLISVRLSHVCRHFRYIITTNPRFWTTISTTPFVPELRLVDACLERSKGCPLDVQLNLYTSFPQARGNQYKRLSPQHVQYDDIFLALRPHIHRWRSVHLNFVPAKRFKAHSGFWKTMQGAVLPILDTISAGGDEREYAANSKLARTSSWKCPRLTGIVLKNCVPNPLPNLAAVTSFDVDFSVSSNVADMLKTLNEMPNIAINNLRLDISKLNPECSGIGHKQLLAANSVSICTVKTFEFGFAANHITDNMSHGFLCVRNILSKLFLPNAETIVLKGSDSLRSSETSLPLDRLLSVVSKRCPKAISCDISISRDPSKYTILPFNLPPNLENLRIVCNTRLTIRRESGEEKIKPAPSSIRRITLGVSSTPNLQTSRAIDWIRGLKERMQKHGNWSSFERLIVLKGVPVDDTGFRTLETVFELEKIIPRERVAEWCESTYVFPEIVSEYKRRKRYEDGYDS
ncbi:hypothetical protein SCHPADRAFT_943502 [Schizopora paradoxa]|uniref:Uncharacterized protein n=1 Tax=Schizopora paradoxa TaxID=27342 RepID=A0A0H2RJL6_9AGAM|nr:hypothetical protein SCHPADRAFT_943502 [Schizopora paradoxa]